MFTNRLLWLDASAGAVPLWGSGCRNLALPGVYEQPSLFPSSYLISFLLNLTHVTEWLPRRHWQRDSNGKYAEKLLWQPLKPRERTLKSSERIHPSVIRRLRRGCYSEREPSSLSQFNAAALTLDSRDSCQGRHFSRIGPHLGARWGRLLPRAISLAAIGLSPCIPCRGPDRPRPS